MVGRVRVRVGVRVMVRDRVQVPLGRIIAPDCLTAVCIANSVYSIVRSFTVSLFRTLGRILAKTSAAIGVTLR